VTDTGSSDRLFAEVDAPGRGPRVVLAHGFTQTRACWGDLPARFTAAEREVMRVDLPGHGRSGHATADLWAAADLLVTTGGPALYLGYSFGARVCLHAALAHREAVTGLVLLGSTPGLVNPAERAARRAEDEERASRLEAVGLEAFLDEWLALPLFAGLRPEDTCRDARLENTVEGLAASLRACGAGTQQPLWVHLDELDMPVLCLAGERDARFAAVGAQMAAGIGPNARFETVPGAGHTAHLEQPDAFWACIEPWLRSLP
jgi:2-succinyl-6-hydroxy-2,4-cyclohexadiene-1-carboxylate synthase